MNSFQRYIKSWSENLKTWGIYHLPLLCHFSDCVNTGYSGAAFYRSTCTHAMNNEEKTVCKRTLTYKSQYCYKSNGSSNTNMKGFFLNTKLQYYFIVH